MTPASELEAIGRDARAAIAAAGTLDELSEADTRFLGRKSRFNEILKDIKNLSDEDKRVIGPLGNRLRTELGEAIDGKRAEFERAEEDRLLQSDRLDLTLPARAVGRGAPHPLVQLTQVLEDIFVGMGYEVAEGPEVETDWHNFQALNIPPDHPARSLMDTYYVTGPRGPEAAILRTHTSPVQIRVMESRKPPIYIVCPGRVFRREDLTPTSGQIFHQIEGLAVDEGLTFADLKGTLQAFCEGAFGPDTRIRLVPSFYPFTEPSAELQTSCPLCDARGCSQCASGWLGMGGAGMVDPNVLEAVGIDPEKCTGFAFGLPIERPLMLSYGVSDIRLLLDGDQRFIRQFRAVPERA